MHLTPKEKYHKKHAKTGTEYVFKNLYSDKHEFGMDYDKLEEQIFGPRKQQKKTKKQKKKKKSKKNKKKSSDKTDKNK